PPRPGPAGEPERPGGLKMCGTARPQVQRPWPPAHHRVIAVARGLKRACCPHSWRVRCEMHAYDLRRTSSKQLYYATKIKRHSERGRTMEKILVGAIVLAISLMVIQDAFARKKDNPNFGYCPNGKKVADITKCPQASKSKK